MRGPEPKVADARDKQLAEQQRMISKLTRRAERAEAIIEVQKKLSRLLRDRPASDRRRERMTAVLDLAPQLGVLATCAALGIDRATYYRHRAPIHGPKPRRPSPPRRLDDAERQTLLDTLHEPRFVDLAPAEVFATLLDEGRYVGSVRTMHRVLAENAEVPYRTPDRGVLLHLIHSCP
jgi:hypothetical protein